ncbi:hypothetical protein HN51_014701 [Arachis hypogaea]
MALSRDTSNSTCHPSSFRSSKRLTQYYWAPCARVSLSEPEPEPEPEPSGHVTASVLIASYG